MRIAQVIDHAPDLTPADIKKFEMVASSSAELDGVRRVPVGIGRSFRTFLLDGTLGSQRFKGAGGFYRDQTGNLRFFPPFPQKSFDVEPYAPHFSLSKNLIFAIARSKGRSLNSLRLDGATTEYNFARSLSTQGLGISAHANGCFLENSEMEKDCFGNTTGFVILNEDPNLCLAKKIWHTHEDALGPDISNLIAQMARVRRLALERCNLAKHSGGLDNYLWDARSGSVFIKDTDTCINIHDSKEEKGAQLLRDVVADLMKIIDRSVWTLLKQNNRSGDFMHRTHPVRTYLSSYFELDDAAIVDHSMEIERKIAGACTQEEVDMNYNSARMIGEKFRPEIMTFVYRLIIQSLMCDRYPIFIINEDELFSRVKHFCESEWWPSLLEWSKTKASMRDNMDSTLR